MTLQEYQQKKAGLSYAAMNGPAPTRDSFKRQLVDLEAAWAAQIGAGGKAGPEAGATQVGDSGDRAKAMGSEVYRTGQNFIQQADKFAPRAAPMVTPVQADKTFIDTSQSNQMREDQRNLITDLARQARGEGPSLAANQLAHGADMNIKQQMALATAARGANPGAALRGVLQGSGATMQNLAGQTADARIAEQNAARTQLGNVLQGARTQDISVATDQAKLLQDLGIANMDEFNKMSVANQDAVLKARGLDDNAIDALRKSGLIGMQIGADTEKSVYATSMGVPSQAMGQKDWINAAIGAAGAIIPG